MLRLLLEAGATVVAEAAFQDNVWTPNLVPLTDIAHLRIVQCHTDPETARQRMRVRSPSRQAHADAEIITSPRYFDDFVRVRLSVPSIAVDTTSGYEPPIDRLVAFVNSQTASATPFRRAQKRPTGNGRDRIGITTTASSAGRSSPRSRPTIRRTNQVG